MLARSRSWRLSPACDLTPGTMRTVTRRNLAMVCGLEGRKPSRWANRGTTVAAEWEGTMRSVGVSQADCEVVRGASLDAGLELDVHNATASSG